MSLTKVSYSMIDGSVVNVLDFGAVGDGVTNDTAAIQAAIDYAGELASTNGGGVVFIPKGVYVVSELILTWRNVTLMGETGYLSQPSIDTTTLLCNTGVFALHIKFTNLPGFSQNKSAVGCGVKNLKISGTTEYGVVISTNATILEEVVVTGFQYGITCFGLNANTFRSVNIVSNTKIGFLVSEIDSATLAFTHPNLLPTLSDTFLINSTIYFIENSQIRENGVGYAARDGYNASIRNTTIESNSLPGILIFSPLTGMKAMATRCYNVWMENNNTSPAPESITGINALKTSPTEYLKGDVNGQWNPSTDGLGYAVWLGSAEETNVTSGVPSLFLMEGGGIYQATNKNALKLRSSANARFRDMQLHSQNLGIELTANSYYTIFDNCTSINNNQIIDGVGLGGTNTVQLRGRTSGNYGALQATQGGLSTGGNAQFFARQSQSQALFSIDSAESGQTIASAASAVLFGNSNTFSGLFVVHDVTNGTIALFLTTNGVITLVSSTTADWSTTSGTGSKNNVFIDTGNILKLQNNLGGTSNEYRTLSFRTKISQ